MQLVIVQSQLERKIIATHQSIFFVRNNDYNKSTYEFRYYYRFMIKPNLGLTMITQYKNEFNQNQNHPNHINHKKLVVSNEVYRIHHSSDIGRNKK